MKCERKYILVIGLLLALFIQVARCQTSAFYVNDGVVLCPPQIPPQINATNFANSNKFIINFTNGLPLLPPVITPPAYETQNTLNYTNGIAGFMSCNMGFRMESFQTAISQRKQASSMFNAGIINSGTLETTNLFTGGVKFLVSATNIVNPGTINMGFESLLSLKGRSINLDRGTIASEIGGLNLFNGFTFFNSGIFDGYWGSGITNSFPMTIIQRLGSERYLR